MADERIDVEVTDKVDASIEKKLEGIASAADRGASHLDRLKSALNNVNASALDRLASAMAKVDSAQARLISAQARLTNAQSGGAVAAQKVALAEQRLATEAARTEAAQAKAAAATIQAELAALRLATAQGRVTGASNAAAGAVNNSANAATHAGAAYNGATGGANAFAGASTRAGAAAGQAAAGANRMAAGFNQNVGAANQYARAARTATAANANIIAQIQDIGVSLAGGQNPLLVLIQQGSQLSYIASTLQGGWTQLLATVGRMLARFAPLLVILGALFLAFKKLQEQAQGEGLEAYIKTLGLTEKEVKKLKDTHVTAGDTIKAAWQEVSKDLTELTGITGKEIQDTWDKTKEYIIAAFRAVVVIIYSLVKTLVVTIGKLVANIGIMFYNAGIAAKNLFLKSIEFLVNKTIEGINKIGEAVNFLSEAAGFGKVVGQLKEIDLGVGDVGDGMKDLIDVDNPFTYFGKTAQETNKYLEDLGGRISKTARQIAEARLKAQAQEIISDRSGRHPKAKVDHTAENRAHAIEMVNLKLDDELARMKLLKDERAIQQRMDQIEEGLAQKKIQLNAQERQTILDKVTAIEKYKYVQAELDRIYEAAIGPMRTYEASQQAITELLAKGAITAQRAAEEQVKANRAYQEATDPLFSMKEALEVSAAASIHYGVALERHNYYEQIRQQLLTRGIVLSYQYVAGVNAEADALMRKNDALIQQQYIQSQISGIVDPITENQRLIDNKAALYAELDRMADAHEITEKQRIQARYALQAKLDETRLQQASQFFGNLASLASSGNKKLAMIGKAAAVAQATVDGVLAVQKALASAPPPLNFALAAAAGVAAAMNVAKIVSTPVGSYATGGQFMVNGKGGIDSNNINMNVTRGERVTVETRKQQKANDNTMTPAAPAPVIVKNYNITDPRDIAAVLDTSEGEHKVLNIIQNNPDVLRRIMG